MRLFNLCSISNQSARAWCPGFVHPNEITPPSDTTKYNLIKLQCQYKTTEGQWKIYTGPLATSCNTNPRHIDHPLTEPKHSDAVGVTVGKANLQTFCHRCYLSGITKVYVFDTDRTIITKLNTILESIQDRGDYNDLKDFFSLPNNRLGIIDTNEFDWWVTALKAGKIKIEAHCLSIVSPQVVNMIHDKNELVEFMNWSNLLDYVLSAYASNKTPIFSQEQLIDFMRNQIFSRLKTVQIAFNPQKFNLNSIQLQENGYQPNEEIIQSYEDAEETEEEEDDEDINTVYCSPLLTHIFKGNESLRLRDPLKLCIHAYQAFRQSIDRKLAYLDHFDLGKVERRLSRIQRGALPNYDKLPLPPAQKNTQPSSELTKMDAVLALK